MTAPRTTALATIAGLAMVVATASGMAAQNPSLPYPYPANDTPLTLPSGILVRERNLVVFLGHNASSLTVVIETPTPATDSARVADETREVANLHSAFAQSNGLSHIMVLVCRTQACLEFRERSAELFDFVRGADGTWVPAEGRGR
ncbi:MAG TPA: hypothetical protein VL524_02145 [Gemmatimonadaceae bacterium]|nr:hypothetical protein [Gemmatimonadaceae bacterium]